MVSILRINMSLETFENGISIEYSKVNIVLHMIIDGVEDAEKILLHSPD